MSYRSSIHGQSLRLAAAAVLVALGSATAFAQQEQERQPGVQQESQQSEQDRLRSAQQEQQRELEQERQSAQQEIEGAAQGAEQQQDQTQIARAEPGQTAGGSLDELMQQHDNLSTFVEALKAAGMEESLTSGTSYTVFAPTNEAFEELSGTDVEELMQPQNREQLVGLLRAHIVADDVDSERARTLQQAQTIDGGTIDITEEEGELMVGEATVEEPDIQQGNLRVHVIDQVLPAGTQQASAEGAEEEESQLR